MTAELNGSSVAGPAPQRPSSAGTYNGTYNSSVATNGSSNGDKTPIAAPQKASTYFGHNREEVTRLLIQALSDMGYREAAESVSRDSSYDLESPTVSALRKAVLDGSWPSAERLLAGAAIVDGGEGNGLVLAAGSDKNVMRFWLRQQKYLELLEQRETGRALAVLRLELTPLDQDKSKLHFLSSLLMCHSAEDLMAKAEWDGANGESRQHLLSQLSKCISPSVMLPENRLAILLQQVKQRQIDTCLYHTEASSPSLYLDHSCDRRNFPSEVALELTEPEGEVWQVQFSHDGSKLAAGGSHEELSIWETKTFTRIKTLHHNNAICNISWSPDDSMLVTCCQDRRARLFNAKDGNFIKEIKRFSEPPTGCVWSADSRSFVIGSLGRPDSICTFNVHDNETETWGKKHRVQDICGSPDGRWLAAVDDAQTIHIYNAITREKEYHIDLNARATSVSISRDSRHLLVNKRDGEVQLIDLVKKDIVQKFLGHTGGEYLIRSAFGGANESFVVSGSEDGKLLIWHKNSGAAVERLHGHEPRCNAVAWNPADPCMLASGGDDGSVKIWTSKARSLELKRSKEANGWRNSVQEA